MNTAKENNLILASTFTITSADTDMYARLRLGSLVNMLIQSAILSADKLGFGHLNLQQNHMFWVLSRLTVEILKPVKWYDKVCIETWPKDINGLLYLRDFTIRQPKGDPVANATSGWLAVDQFSKRPKNVDAPSTEAFTRLKDLHALEGMPPKLPPIQEGEAYEIHPTYFDLDMNKHVTSTRYIDWMMDTFPLEFLEERYPSTLSVNYMKETLPGEKLKLLRKAGANDRFCFEGSNQNHSTAFRGEIGF